MKASMPKQKGSNIWVSYATIWWKNQLIIFLEIVHLQGYAGILYTLIPPLDSGFPELASHINIQLNFQFFMEAIILLCWSIWTARNELIFKGIRMDLSRSRCVFFRELKLLQYRVKAGQEETFFMDSKSRIDNLFSFDFLCFFLCLLDFLPCLHPLPSSAFFSLSLCCTLFTFCLFNLMITVGTLAPPDSSKKNIVTIYFIVSVIVTIYIY